MSGAQHLGVGARVLAVCLVGFFAALAVMGVVAFIIADASGSAP